MPIELLTMIGGGITGFIFRYLAERAKERADFYKMAIGMKEAQDTSADKAAERVSVDAGKWVRRAIVVCILFGVILAPFILSLLGQSTIVQVETQSPEWFFGLFGGGTDVVFVELKGYLMIPEVRQTLTAIVGFYFGNASARTK
jgi:mannose/fructose/N-acetylgalactosamine-specific phosphotransferase system component IIC|tara:strand:- start:5090 stop:5521 length:432 start_codon:yes stop_codon:yes gene_type:complete